MPLRLSLALFLSLFLTLPVHAASATEQFQQIVNILAAEDMEGRAPGSKGIEKARDYIVDQFKAAGLQPAFDTVAGKSYLQPLEVSLGTVVKTQKLSGADENGKGILMPGAGDGYQLQSFSANGSFRGEAVFIGYSIVDADRKYDSFAGGGPDMLKGKVAICFRYEPQDTDGRSLWARADAEAGKPKRQWTDAASLINKAQWAAKHGAEALLFVNPPTQDSDGLRPLSRTQQRVGIPVMHITPSVFKQLLKAADMPAGNSDLRDLQRRADKGSVITPLPGVRLKGEAKLAERRATSDNVAAILPGKGKLADQFIVVGAHYDHLGHGLYGSLAGSTDIHPGADDNASGVAGVILLARQLIARQALPASPLGDSHRSVLFICFTAEEGGLIGSRYFTKNFADAGIKTEDVVAMLNMDMIGRLRKDKLWVMGVGTAKEWRDKLNAAADELKLKLTTSDSGAGPSDHANFYVKDIPVLHFFTGVHGDYHRPSDTADKVNAKGGVRVVQLLARLTDWLLTAEQPPAFQKTKAAPSRGGGSGAYLGIMPDYSDGEGLGVTDVMSDGPADEAGLKPGDVITQWDETPIKNIYDLTDALRKSKPGDEVKLQVQRENETVNIDIKLGNRG